MFNNERWDKKESEKVGWWGEEEGMGDERSEFKIFFYHILPSISSLALLSLLRIY
jgi:hypothetical protein